MRRNVFLAAALLLALGTIGLLSQPAKAYGQEGAVMTGVWYWQNDVSPGILPSVLTFHNDGTVFCSDALAFGGVPTAMNPFNYTPFYGVWKRTGPHEYTATWLSLPFDRATGLLAGIVRVRAKFAFVGDFDHFEGTMTGEALFSDTTSPFFPLNCPDPLAPDAAWTPMWNVSFHAARVSVVPY
jgi:hypothetical protein